MVEGDLEALGDEIARTSTAIDQATHRVLELLRAFDAGAGWAASGNTSCAAWLSWKTGMTPGPARERVRIAHRLAELPMIDAAFAAGELSYSKVRALTRVADAESEELLLEDARLMTGAELERLVKHLRRVKLADGECDVEPERFFRQRTTDEGMVQLTVQLTADEAAVVTAALDAAPKGVRRAEALVAMADQKLRGDAPNRSPSEVMVHIDAKSLAGEVAGSTDDGELLGAETCRRLLCDAGVVPVSRMNSDEPSMSGERPGASHQRSAGRWRSATAAAAFPAATIRSSTATTSNTGSMTARRAWATW